VYNSILQKKINGYLANYNIKEVGFAQRLGANVNDIAEIFQLIYGDHPQAEGLFEALLDQICQAHIARQKLHGQAAFFGHLSAVAGLAIGL
jgi:hypothetical protein